MAIEIERKFLLSSEAWRGQAVSVMRMRQGYVAAAPDRSVRVRVAGPHAWLTLKFGRAGPAREEFEYPIPLGDAEAILAHAARTIDKERHIVPWHDLVFEVDVFHGRLEGLVLAELETERTVGEDLLPEWIGREVTDDSRYYNAVLVRDGLPENPT
ncbi:CYTH domain-containing protein [Aliihoeflea sp. 40Bstr573]|uniref:CYTH domain-containing protein n=1 Tax=Aliihoeflea sp. 40Bstr573 TaxID=2696467 RepID=UPI002095CD72|nr:CYTH domain-containing protein [Aliihoeflea sp. 40Bstr573]MCO6388863.1 CYTH domain-containing protein [Aliihoeflea sp. 40Bstr573]